MRKYDEEDRRGLARWGLDCAERVLPIFEGAAPNDPRPRHAIEVGREWVATGEFSMRVIRAASLGAHAAAKAVVHMAGKSDADREAACQAAHAAGQAVAAAHVPQHALGSAYYALRALAASAGGDAAVRAREELDWQAEHLPAHLRAQVMGHLTVRTVDGSVRIRLTKGPDF